MDAIVEYVKLGGLLMFVTLLISLILLISGIVLLFIIKHRKTASLYRMLAFTPLITGAGGTLFIYIKIDDAVTAISSVNADLLNDSYQQAWTHLYTGTASSLILLFITYLLFKKVN